VAQEVEARRLLNVINLGGDNFITGTSIEVICLFIF